MCGAIETVKFYNLVTGKLVILGFFQAMNVKVIIPVLMVFRLMSLLHPTDAQWEVCALDIRV
jgi:hypothetical protein